MIKRKTRSDKITFDKKQMKTIERLSGIGLNQAQIAHILNVSVDTLQRRVKEGDMDLSAAIHKGKSKAVGKIAEKAYEIALNGNISMIKYYLSAQGGWVEKPQECEECKRRDDEEAFRKHNLKSFEDLVDAMTDEELSYYRTLLNKQEELFNKVEGRKSP
jgi:predicted DNA-binding protein (UPF0251 family)